MKQVGRLPSAKEVAPVEEPVQEQVDEPEQTQEVPQHPMQEDTSAEDLNNMRASMPSENLKEHIVEPMASDVNNAGASTFTSSYQFLDAQNNSVPGSNEESSVATFANQHSIQGMQDNSPDGHGSGEQYAQL